MLPDVRATADLTVTDVVRARWPALSRYAVMLTGDRARAQSLLVDVLASGGAGPDDALDDPETEVKDALARICWQQRAGPVREPSVAADGTGQVHDESEREEDQRAAELAAARAALESLPGRERVSLVLRLVDGLDEDQAAQVLHTRAARVRRTTDAALGLAAATISTLLDRPVPGHRAQPLLADALTDVEDPGIPYADTTSTGDAARRRRRTRRGALVAASLVAVAAVGFSLVPPRAADPPAPADVTGPSAGDPSPLEAAAQPLEVLRHGVPAPAALREVLGRTRGTSLRRQLPPGLVGTLQPQSGDSGSAVLVAAGRYDRRTGRPIGPIALVDFALLRYQLLEEIRPLHPEAIGVDVAFVSWIGREGVACRDRRTGDRTGLIGEDPQGVLAVSQGRRAWQIVRGDLQNRFVAIAEGCRGPKDLRVDGRLRAFEWPWVYVVGDDGLVRVDARTGRRVALDRSAASSRDDERLLVDGSGDRAAWVADGRVRVYENGGITDLGEAPFGGPAQDGAVALGTRLVTVSGRVGGATRSRVYDMWTGSTADLDQLATVIGSRLVIQRDRDVLVFSRG